MVKWAIVNWQSHYLHLRSCFCLLSSCACSPPLAASAPVLPLTSLITSLSARIQQISSHLTTFVLLFWSIIWYQLPNFSLSFCPRLLVWWSYHLFWLIPVPQYSSTSFPDSKHTLHLTLALNTVPDLQILIAVAGKSTETVRPVKCEHHQYLTVTLKGSAGEQAKGGR